MQTYPLNLNPAGNPATVMRADANLFVYESGVVTPSTGDSRIVVKPDSGTEIVLRPGQRFRMARGENAVNWAVRPNDPAVSILGSLIIGSGEFDDSATINSNITNTTANRVPVSLDLAQIPVVVVQGAGQYATAWQDSSIADVNGIVVFTPAANVNGAWLEFAQITEVGIGTNQTWRGLFIAKNAVPATIYDGDVILFAAIGGATAGSAVNAATVAVELPARVKIPAGKGLYFNQTGGGSVPTIAFKNALYTLL